MNIIKFCILKLFNYELVRCRVCNKWTEPCISLPGINERGDICSFECLSEESSENYD